MYINLEHRVDRKFHVEEQLQKIGILNAERFNAVKLKNGALGCSMSHLKCLELAKKSGWDHIMIVEDDITFLDPELFVNQFNEFLSIHKVWDVVLIGGNNVPPYQTVDSTCIKVSKCQTTTGYMVRSHYYDYLIENIRNGINHLLREPDKHIMYAIDKYWFTLQQQHLWYLIIPLSVTQREDYSDIEKRPTNYAPAMLDIDKIALMKSQIKKKQEQEQSKPKLKLFNLPH
jgi:GR25 family glycosyltransferase involved in LPS biosynthesis